MLNYIDTMLYTISFMSETASDVISTIITIASIITLLIGIAFCLWGYKIVRVLFAICGALLGSMLGSLFCTLVLESNDAMGLCAVIGAILGAVLLFKLYQVGVFLLAFCLGTFIIALVTSFSSDAMPICLLVGVIVGVLAVIWIRPAIIISTSLSGGSTAATGLCVLLGITDGSVTSVIALALTIIGIVYQFKHTDKYYGKKAAPVAANATTTTSDITVTITPTAPFTTPVVTTSATAPSVTPTPAPTPELVTAPPSAVIEPEMVVAPVAEPEVVTPPTVEPETAIPPVVEAPAPTQEPTTTASFCASCSAPLRQGAKFCGICGTPTT